MFQFNLFIIISFLSCVNQGKLRRARHLLDGGLARKCLSLRREGLEVDEMDRAVRARVLRAAPCIVRLDAPRQVIRPARVEAAVRTFEDVGVGLCHHSGYLISMVLMTTSSSGRSAMSVSEWPMRRTTSIPSLTLPKIV